MSSLYVNIIMKRLDFNREKSKMLKKERGIGFEEIAQIIEKERFIEVIDHPNKRKYPTQKIFLIKLKNYIYAVPYVEDDEKIFLKTIYASRAYTKKFYKKYENKNS